MLMLQDLFMHFSHFGYAAVVDFIVEVSDHYVTHLVMVFMVKAGVVHVGWKIVKRRKAKKDVPVQREWDVE